MTRLLRSSFALLAAALLAAPASASTSPAPPPPQRKANKSQPDTGPLYATRPEVLQAAEEMAARNGLDIEWARQAVGQARLLPQVQRLMTPAPRGTPKNWTLYRSRFVEPIRIRAGTRFWQAHRASLERAERELGVPAEIIVGIIGVETIYGQQTGNFPVIDALTTLAFDFPAAHPRAAERSAFFKGELEHLLSLSQRHQVAPHSWRGSYAGAMGLPQFMPSSWARFAIDFDGDGRIDLLRSADDVIGSVANYLKAFGWQSGMPATYPVTFAAETVDMDALLAPDILPSFTVASFTAKGAQLQGEAMAHAGPLALIELQNGDAAPQYVAGTENFYVITRYNWSSYYAMAVLELGQAVRAARER
jgi:membrane-bound lytic murein transglycosylase B